MALFLCPKIACYTKIYHIVGNSTTNGISFAQHKIRRVVQGRKSCTITHHILEPDFQTRYMGFRRSFLALSNAVYEVRKVFRRFQTLYVVFFAFKPYFQTLYMGVEGLLCELFKHSQQFKQFKQFKHSQQFKQFK